MKSLIDKLPTIAKQVNNKPPTVKMTPDEYRKFIGLLNNELSHHKLKLTVEGEDKDGLFYLRLQDTILGIVIFETVECYYDSKRIKASSSATALKRLFTSTLKKKMVYLTVMKTILN